MQVTKGNLCRTAALFALVLTSGCSEEGAWRNPAIAQQAEGKAEAAYLAPPVLTSLSPMADGALALHGVAEPGARVRLGSPTGESLFAQTDAKGAWTLNLPKTPSARLYGLSMAVADRTVQAEGYVVILPDSRAVRLRAGAGAIPLTGPSDRLRILAIDYDRDGGAVVSGQATPGAALVLRIDGVDAQGKVDTNGRFSIAATEPLSSLPHQILVAGDGEDRVTVAAVRAGPLDVPVRAVREAGGWRIEWMTPGGGVQTTVIPLA
jgi:hypothetical protein